MSEDQLFYLNPTPGDILVGNILQDSVGQNAKKKIAKRRIDFITGNIASYSRSLNNAATLDHIIDTNKLASCLSTVIAAKDAVKAAAKDKRETDTKAKAAKKTQNKVEFDNKKVEISKDFADDIAKGVKHLCSLSNEKLKLLLKYYFEVPNALSQLRRGELVALLEEAGKKDSDQEVAEGEEQEDDCNCNDIDATIVQESV